MSVNDSGTPGGQQKAQVTWGQYNNIMFAIQQALSKMQTATLVRVERCSNSGGLTPVGYVDVTPMVHQVDGQGNPIAHKTIYNVPYLRIQGGANAIIIDPQPGDIGMCAFASRDISTVKSTRAPGMPGSFRQYSFADGIYLGGMLNGSPTQYIQFTADGITIHSPTVVTLSAPAVNITANDVAVTSATFTHNGVNVGSTHTHGGVTIGGGSTGGPA